MFIPRTDLAAEAHDIASKNKKHIIDGVIYNEENLNGFTLTRVEILNRNGEKETGKPIGKYLSLSVDKLWEKGIKDFINATVTLSDMINELAGDGDSLLVAGLGNVSLTADALGPMSTSHVIVTHHLKELCPKLFEDMSFFDVSAICPGVLSQTGIEAKEFIKGAAKKLNSPTVIAIDALASSSITRLGTVIQISDSGIAPGSGVGNSRAPLNRDTLGAPVISIGVPTVVDALTLTDNVIEMCGNKSNRLVNERADEYKNLFVTPKDCDKIVAYMSKVIGYAINKAFHSKLSLEEILSISN